MRIEEYEFGRIVIDGREEHRDVIITPEELHTDWWRDEGHALTLDDLGPVLDDPPDLLVVGTGTNGNMRPVPGLVDALAERGVHVAAEPTPKAVERFNRELAAGERTVAAALHLTC